MYACSEFGDGFELNLGNPYVEPPRMSIREFCLAFGEGDPERWWRENWLFDEHTPPIDLDDDMDPFTVMDWWLLKYSSNARAYHFLEGLDLGPRLSAAKVAGELDFICGAAPGVDYLGVRAVDEITLSLLQERLNQLGTGIAVKLY